MARPKIRKIVNILPLYTYYKPQGIPITNLDIEILSVEELEALKLKDKENFDQVSAAKKMGISRSTFQRLLKSARSKVVDSIIEGKALKIEGGNYIPNKDMVVSKCLKGSYHFYIRREDLKGGEEEYKLSKVKCPECGKRLVDFK